MSAKLISIEGFEQVDPQSPLGGPDGTKDILAYKHGKKFVIGCYFPNGQKSYTDIKDKFDGDLEGVSKNNAQGFVFITNQKITPSQRISLAKDQTIEIDILHGERVCGLLDSPKGYGIRLEYLGIELTREEQISFLNSHLDLKEDFKEIKTALDEIRKVTNQFAGQIHSRDLAESSLSTLPISGVPFSSRLSLEDLLSLHRAILTETQGEDFSKFLGFRKVEVWIGKPGQDKNSADLIPTAPSEVIRQTVELLKWWREEYLSINYGSETDQISAIATFHERFLRIHPFLDGNGRVARTIASIQYKDLLSKEVKFENLERKEYYEALKSAIDGDKQQLTDIFNALIKE
ncbi:MAG: Fic family protein [Allomuricauda sp.]